MSNKSNTSSSHDDTPLSAYNTFCKRLRAGDILYNINHTNGWGEYLLAAHIIHVRVGNADTYTVLLLGLKKQDGKYVPRNLSISLTPDDRKQVPFLKPVGYGQFTLIPAFDSINVNVGLVAVFSQTDLHKFASKLAIRKPGTHKYDKDGKPIIKKNGN